MKHLFLLFALIINFNSAFGQMPPDEFFSGLDLMKKDQNKAKVDFFKAIKKDASFYGSYHFLGIIHQDNLELDSAIYYFEKAVKLNTGNYNSTQELAYDRLIHAHLSNHNFTSSFNIAKEAHSKYAQNKVISKSLKDVCLWSVYIHHNELDSTYLSPELKSEYVVNTVAEEYLILRKIRVNGKYLIVKKQQKVKKKKIDYDLITCNLSKSDEEIVVKFKLNWESKKIIGEKNPDTKSIYANATLPIYERLGALLIEDPKINLKEEITKLEVE